MFREIFRLVRLQVVIKFMNKKYAKNFHEMKVQQTSDNYAIIIHHSFVKISLYLNDVSQKSDVAFM